MSVIATSTNVFSTVIKHEYEPSVGFCREAVTVYDSASTFTPGSVLGRFLASPVCTPAAVVGTGNGSIGTVTGTGKAIVGTYTLRIVLAAANAGNFELFNPNGVLVGVGTVGTAFVSPDMTFTLADGSTDFALGDTIAIAVTGTYKYKLVEATATDGTAVAAGIYIADALGNSGDVAIAANTDTTVLAIVRGPVVYSKDELSFGASVDTTAEKNKAYAELAALGIVAATTA
jgi:hypothetical protein